MEQIIADLQNQIMHAGVWSPVLYILAMTLAIVFAPIPSSPLAVFAGAAFGWVKGMILTMIGAILGAAIAFLIARVLGKRIVVKIIGQQKFDEAENLLSEKNLTLAVFLLRLPPLPVFDAVSYIAGLTKIKFGDFLIATFFGMIPLVFVFSYFGSSLTNFMQIFWGVIFVLITPLFVYWIYKRKRRK